MKLQDSFAKGRNLHISVCWLVSGYNRMPSSHGRCSKGETSSSSTVSSTTPSPAAFSSTLTSTTSSLTSAGPLMTSSSSTASSTTPSPAAFSSTLTSTTSSLTSSTTPVPPLVGCCQNSTLTTTSNGSVCKVLLVRQCFHIQAALFLTRRGRKYRELKKDKGVSLWF